MAAAAANEVARTRKQTFVSMEARNMFLILLILSSFETNQPISDNHS
jgi:hypothetical protein